LANIKADLRTRIGEFDKKVEIESTAVCTIQESKSYEQELQQELSKTILLQEFHGSDMVRPDDSESSQVTPCRIMRQEEQMCLLQNDQFVEEMGHDQEEGEPELISMEGLDIQESGADSMGLGA